MVTVAVGSGSAVSSGEIVSLGGPDGTNGPGNMGGPGGGFGGSSTVTQGSSANTISEDGVYSNETYTSTGDDENALRIDGAAVTLEGITVDKSAGATSNTENGDFYGVNAALLATNGATVTITNATVTSSAQNGNGVFSYGSGTTVNISDSTITTTADNSGGIQTTGGGTTNAENLTVETSGNSSAAIRSDRGGGTVKVTGGVYTSGGYNSPAVYSTADITVKNAVLTANRSEALVIEGKNSIVLENCTVSGNMSDTQGASSDENVHNVMIYQSMSGDADVGTSVFSMTGGSLTAKNGDMFYITNTHCILTLSGVRRRRRSAAGRGQQRQPRLGLRRQQRRAGRVHRQRPDAGGRYHRRLHLHAGADAHRRQQPHRHGQHRGKRSGRRCRRQQCRGHHRQRLHLGPHRRLRHQQPGQQRHHQFQRLYHHAGRRHGAAVSFGSAPAGKMSFLSSKAVL